MGGKGLVAAILDQGSVDCVSGTSAVNGTIVGKYTFRLFWWGKGTADVAARWHTARWTYDSSINSAAVLTSGSDVWDPANTVLGNGRRLSELVQGSGTAPNIVATGASNGLRGFPTGVFTLTTAPTLFNETSSRVLGHQRAARAAVLRRGRPAMSRRLRAATSPGSHWSSSWSP